MNDYETEVGKLLDRWRAEFRTSYMSRANSPALHTCIEELQRLHWECAKPQVEPRTKAGSLD